jgi:hypothetical protein
LKVAKGGVKGGKKEERLKVGKKGEAIRVGKGKDKEGWKRGS